MYVVYNSSNEVVVMCSRLEDANAYLSTNLDDTQYVIKEMPDKEMDEHIIRMAEMEEDGIGEGQIR